MHYWMQLLTKLKLELSIKKYILFIPALIWAGIIVFMSLLPHEELPYNVLLVSDKIIHTLIYFVLALLIVIALIYQYHAEIIDSVVQRKYLVSALFAFVFGVLIEVAQQKMDIGRSGDWKDVIANSFGILIVYPFVKMMQRRDVFNVILRSKYL